MCGSVNAAKPTNTSCMTDGCSGLPLDSAKPIANAANTANVGHSAIRNAPCTCAAGRLPTVRKLCRGLCMAQK